MSGRIPVTLLTGFLGSGKTTLLNRLLDRPEGLQAAVLINEFGKVGLDHLLARPVQGTKVIIQNGCICCTVHESLRDSMRSLFDARDAGAIPPFDRLLIETSGASDPMPIVMTLRGDPLFRHQLRLESIVSTVDALNGLQQIDARRVVARQVGMADHLVITKTDLCDPEKVGKLAERLVALAPRAEVHASATRPDLWSVLTKKPEQRPFPARVTAWGSGLDTWRLHRDGTGLNSFSITFDASPDWSRFAVWLSLLMHRYGDRILRIKGLLSVAGDDRPLVLNAVQHYVHPPEHLAEWPDDDHRSRLVFITEGIDEGAVHSALSRILGLPADGDAMVPVADGPISNDIPSRRPR